MLELVAFAINLGFQWSKAVGGECVQPTTGYRRWEMISPNIIILFTFCTSSSKASCTPTLVLALHSTNKVWSFWAMAAPSLYVTTLEDSCVARGQYRKVNILCEPAYLWNKITELCKVVPYQLCCRQSSSQHLLRSYTFAIRYTNFEGHQMYLDWKHHILDNESNFSFFVGKVWHDHDMTWHTDAWGA